MRKRFSLTLLLATMLALSANANPLWMRYNAISPDGKTIAFAYQGDIYTVSANGGMAQKLVATPNYEYNPVWSPDSKSIAYMTDANGNFDIYTINLAEGTPRRVTTHSVAEQPLTFTPDGKEIIYNAFIQKPASSVQFPTGWMKEVYSVSINGGRPRQIFTVPAMNATITPDGKTIYYEKATGSEDEWRKHHTSSVARNIFAFDTESGKHTQITVNPGEDRNPVILDDKLYYLSEQNNQSFNIYSLDPKNPKSTKQITNHTNHPVRFLSVAQNGTLCYNYMGEIYTVAANGKSQKVNITVPSEINCDTIQHIGVTSAKQHIITPDGKQIFAIVRGDVVAFSSEYAVSKQITNTPAAERGISAHPKGRTIVYASEQSGQWALYTASIARNEELDFANATLIDHKPLLPDNSHEQFAPQFSPNGEEIAYIEDRGKLMVYNTKTKQTRQITDGSYHYATDDYGFNYEWSPDGKWFTLEVISNVRQPYSNIAIVSAEKGGEIYNITNTAYINHSPQWAIDGNAIIFTSNRLGMRSHASWGSQEDIFIAYLNQETYDKFTLTEEEYKLKKAEDEHLKKLNSKEEDDKKDKKNKKDKKGDKKKDEEKKPETKAVEIDLDNIDERVMRLTPMSSNIYTATLSPDGETLYFTSQFEKNYDLWTVSTREHDTKILKKNVGAGSLQLDKEGKNLFALGSKMQKIDTKSGSGTPISLKMTINVNTAQERRAMFNHVFLQQTKRFYKSDYHGVDLVQLKKDYEPFLAHISNNYDFSEMLSEILGELNVSHTGSGYRPYPAAHSDQTADMGVYLDLNYEGDGLKIDEIIANGAFDTKYTKATKGTIIKKIDGTEITAGLDYFPLLNNKAGQKVLVTLYNPDTKATWDEVIKPTTTRQLSRERYDRWVKSRAEETKRLSNGRLGYVHIQSMADPSYREVYARILGEYNTCEGIVIDTRYNSGGRLHEDIEILFSGEKYLEQTTQGRKNCDMPSRRYNKKSIMLVCEANYSNAHGTPWVYNHKKMGSIVGMPVPGTMTSVNWETLQDPTLYFGIPVIGYLTKEGYYLENTQLEPDILVDNDPETVTAGRDLQLEAAVKELLEQIDNDKTSW